MAKSVPIYHRNELQKTGFFQQEAKNGTRAQYTTVAECVLCLLCFPPSVRGITLSVVPINAVHEPGRR